MPVCHDTIVMWAAMDLQHETSVHATMEDSEGFPAEFPAAWASDWGEDAYGLWMSLCYRGVRQ